MVKHRAAPAAADRPWLLPIAGPTATIKQEESHFTGAPVLPNTCSPFQR